MELERTRRVSRRLFQKTHDRFPNRKRLWKVEETLETSWWKTSRANLDTVSVDAGAAARL